MTQDPVCKMKVEEPKARHESSFQGKTYYFCSADCKDKFDKNPKAYV